MAQDPGGDEGDAGGAAGLFPASRRAGAGPGERHPAAQADHQPDHHREYRWTSQAGRLLGAGCFVLAEIAEEIYLFSLLLYLFCLTFCLVLFFL